MMLQDGSPVVVWAVENNKPALLEALLNVDMMSSIDSSGEIERPGKIFSDEKVYKKVNNLAWRAFA